MPRPPIYPTAAAPAVATDDDVVAAAVVVGAAVGSGISLPVAVVADVMKEPLGGAEPPAVDVSSQEQSPPPLPLPAAVVVSVGSGSSSEEEEEEEEEDSAAVVEGAAVMEGPVVVLVVSAAVLVPATEEEEEEPEPTSAQNFSVAGRTSSVVVSWIRIIRSCLHGQRGELRKRERAKHTQGRVDAAALDDAGCGGVLDGVHVFADADKVGGLAATAAADAADDALERALREDADVLGRGGRGQREEGSAVLHYGGWCRSVVLWDGEIERQRALDGLV
jgi:hypothetical protein